MRRSTPIHARPDFVKLENDEWLEYRVEARTSRPKRLFRDGFGADALVVLGTAYCWHAITSSSLHATVAAVLLSVYIYCRITRVIWESVVILPSLGLQFETHRGFAGLSLFSARKFVPWSSLEDFLINEGLRGWNVRYYLVAIHRTQQGTLQLKVAFENILPRFPVLLEVYRGVQEALRDESSHCKIYSSMPTSTDSEDNK
ncbi:hypothetical protein BD414DRAFT_475183 [Trametes punicea]|nr:hypothetical protein BD414DRAFT_475183 [Trametes punicea]